MELVSYYQSDWYTSYAFGLVLWRRIFRIPFRSVHRISDPGILKSRATGRSGYCKFVRWRLICVARQRETGFTSPSWRLQM